MKCILISKDGKIKYVEKKDPKIKKEWALIKVMSAGLCGSDITKILSDKKARTLITNKIWGHEFSGIITDIEKNRVFKKGDRVTVQPLIFDKSSEIIRAKSLGKYYDGGFSEYALVPIKNLRRLPANLTFELATLSEPLACSLHAYHIAGSPKNKEVLIIGDGPISLCVLVICKKFNNKVTIIGKHSANLKIARRFGAKVISNYSKLHENYFDSVFECIGRSQNKSLETAISALKSKGKIIVLGVFRMEYKNKLILRDLFFKEGQLLGSNCYLPNEFDDSIKFLENEKLKFEKFIVHVSPLKDFKRALGLIKTREKYGPIKIIFRP